MPEYHNPEAITIIQANRDLLLHTMPSLGISEILSNTKVMLIQVMSQP